MYYIWSINLLHQSIHQNPCKKHNILKSLQKTKNVYSIPPKPNFPVKLPLNPYKFTKKSSPWNSIPKFQFLTWTSNFPTDNYTTSFTKKLIITLHNQNSSSYSLTQTITTTNNTLNIFFCTYLPSNIKKRTPLTQKIKENPINFFTLKNKNLSFITTHDKHKGIYVCVML